MRPKRSVAPVNYAESSEDEGDYSTPPEPVAAPQTPVNSAVARGILLLSPNRQESIEDTLIAAAEILTPIADRQKAQHNTPVIMPEQDNAVAPVRYEAEDKADGEDYYKRITSISKI